MGTSHRTCTSLGVPHTSNAPCRRCLQHVLGEDLKVSDIEVGLASAQDGGRFRVLSCEELEEHLVAISERD